MEFIFIDQVFKARSMVLRFSGIFLLGWISVATCCFSTYSETEQRDEYASLDGMGDFPSSDHPPLEGEPMLPDSEILLEQETLLSEQESLPQEESVNQGPSEEYPPVTHSSSLDRFDPSNEASSSGDLEPSKDEESGEEEMLNEQENRGEEFNTTTEPKALSNDAEKESNLMEDQINNEYDFGMLSVGMEMGLGFGSSSVKNPIAGRTSSISYSSKQGGLGMRLTWEYPLSNDWMAGATAAIRYYLGSSKGNEDSVIPLFSVSYKDNQMQRYELSGKFGKTIGTLNPYIKGGILLGTFSARYAVSGFSSSKRDYAWGGTVGLGIDTTVAEGISIGGVMEYDHYGEIRGNLTNSVGAVGSNYKLAPSMLNAMLTLRFNVDRW